MSSSGAEAAEPLPWPRPPRSGWAAGCGAGPSLRTRAGRALAGVAAGTEAGGWVVVAASARVGAAGAGRAGACAGAWALPWAAGWPT